MEQMTTVISYYILDQGHGREIGDCANRSSVAQNRQAVVAVLAGHQIIRSFRGPSFVPRGRRRHRVVSLAMTLWQRHAGSSLVCQTIVRL